MFIINLVKKLSLSSKVYSVITKTNNIKLFSTPPLLLEGFYVNDCLSLNIAQSILFKIQLQKAH